MHDDVIEVLKMFPEHARDFWENLHLTYDLRETSQIFKESDFSSDCENSETTRNDFNFILLKIITYKSSCSHHEFITDD